MYKEISKLIMYGNLDNNSILSSMADIFNRFDNDLSSKEELITDIYTQITIISGRIILHTFLLLMKTHSVSHVKRLVLMTEVLIYLQRMTLKYSITFSIMILVRLKKS